jgi:uncharacterized membrane protein YhaH (DUF805 family)
MWESRVAPLSGLLFVALIVAGSVVINNYEFMPAPEEIAAFYRDESARIMAGGYMGLLSSFFLLWFTGSVKAALSRGQGGSDRLATIAFGGGVLAAGMVALSYMAMFYGAERASLRGGIDPGGAAVLSDLASGAVGTAAPYGLAALVGAFAIFAIRTRTQPGWLAWISLVIAVGLISPINYIVIAMAVIWVAVVSIRLYRENAAESEQEPTTLA